jgi:chromate transport protein ChrA
MSRFWQLVSALLLVAGAIIVVSAPAHRGDMPHPATKPIIAGLLVTAVWATGFRKQLERGRLSLFSLFVLVTLLASWFAAHQYFNPGR